jgi:hypothetical protein
MGMGKLGAKVGHLLHAATVSGRGKYVVIDKYAKTNRDKFIGKFSSKIEAKKAINRNFKYRIKSGKYVWAKNNDYSDIGPYTDEHNTFRKSDYRIVKITNRRNPLLERIKPIKMKKFNILGWRIGIGIKENGLQ